MTQQKKMQSNILTIIAPAYQEKSYNMVFIDSMLNQTRQGGWKAVCIHNGEVEPDSGFRFHNQRLKNTFPLDCVQYINLHKINDYRFDFYNSEKNTGNWGTANRQWVIDNCDTEYILQTSVQDYWLPQAMEYIIGTLEKNKPDILIWNSINHLVGPCQVLNSELEWSKVDWGNFCIRTDIAKKVGINHGDAYCADWGFIVDVLQSGLVDKNKIMKLPYILTIHN